MNGETGFGETIMRTIFDKGVGSPIWGNPNNFSSLDAYTMQ